jgi:hypothetical protein
MDEKLDPIAWFQSEMIAYRFRDRSLTFGCESRFHKRRHYFDLNVIPNGLSVRQPIPTGGMADVSFG